MSDRVLVDAGARQRILEDLDTTLFVEAAAGTGKTTALVGRMVGIIRAGAAQLEQMVAVTFTEKAAGEMKLRLRSELERARAAELATVAERKRFETALAQLELAHIGTVHSFCGDLLHERPVEAGVDPLFQVAPEDESRALLDQAFETWFQQTLANPPEGVRRILRRRPRGFLAQGPRDMLRSAVRSLIEHRDFTTAWRRPELDREAALDEILAELEALGQLGAASTWPEDYLTRNLTEIGRFCEEVGHMERVRGRDYDGLEADLRFLTKQRSWRWKGARRTRYGNLDQPQVLARRDELKMRLDEVMAACDADVAALLHLELQPVVDAYEVLKTRAGKLDFLDLLIRARNLVRDDAGVRHTLQARFTHYFVDEFQDTDPLQAEILLLLAADAPDETRWQDARPRPGKLFLVGDPKQSIYRFRRADVAIYEDIKRTLTGRGADVLHLSTSFRGLPSLQRFVNAAFEPVMRGGGQAEYVPLEAYREEVGGQPSVVALPVPKPYGDYGTIVNWRIDGSFPDAVGAFVAWLVNDSGWTVGEGGEQVPVRPRHVCVLFRRFKSFNRDVTRDYVRALETRRIPHVLVGGRSFHDREEVQAVRNALAAIEWPDDELRVFATLRGPLFALGDDALLAFWSRNGQRLHPMRPLEVDELDDSDREVARALEILRDLHRARNRRPVAETVNRLLGAVRAHAGIAIWPTGEQALANVLRTVDMARRFERHGAPSFRAFVERLEDEAERGEAEDAPVVEEGTEGVRIMTAHKSKGLEFPVVILADPTCTRVRDLPGRHVDVARGLWTEPLCGCAPVELLEAASEERERDDQESVRLAYVAATRARDLLVAPVVGDAECAGWIDVLNPALYPADDRKHLAAVAEGCPRFGAESLVEPPANARRPNSGPVRPGLHRARAGGNEVVWWDPNVLELDAEERVGVRQQRILEADQAGRADASEREHERWQTARSAAIDAGSTPSLAVQSVTQRAERVAGLGADGQEVAVETVDMDRSGRPGGRRFGTLVHAVLAEVGLDADGADVEALARAQGRLVGATVEEVEAACVAVLAALAHPLMRRASQSANLGGLRRETPVVLRTEDGVLVEGIVDLAFREVCDAEARWTVVDFKTDRSPVGSESKYAAQVRLYVRAVEEATGEPAAGALLVV